ncbi:acyl-CoA dehydrogenase family protein [Aquamicrobium sp. LC103]|uniref:acyl-CoA dehydrogenase family protein n=1 Tax=Aquamicrobium sp. LC103 TaxID=1120658 RepID=UPI00063E9C0F|nr:acyl-CoA dehydrogenase family protein [Aquamicrobium sp. LC103]TKT74500.1 acyl-CoA dehydrogenase [Aquamicrobium sp. LC103]
MSEWHLWPWPFFEAAHIELAERAAAWKSPVDHEVSEAEFPTACREIARSLGDAGLLAPAVPSRDAEGRWNIDVRSLCIVREAVAYESALADAVLAMQGIGTGAIWMHGSEEHKARYLDRVRRGEAIAAFALTEPTTGSDVASITTTARREGDHYILDGEKTFISNAGIADHYIVVARTGEAPGSRGLTAFIVDADNPGVEYGAPIELMAPHPLAPMSFRNCRVPGTDVIGEAGRGFGVAMATFDVFRTSVGAASVGMGRRAFDETLAHVRTRKLFGGAMAQIAGVQTKIADMSIDLETAALAVYRAAWVKDTAGGRGTREASMAKLMGSEAAGRVIDSAVQLFGGLGVTRGSIVEQLYREVRPTRIYEGASEVQKLVIGRSLVEGKG